MSWKQHVLVVANQTAASRELLSALTERAARAPTTIDLIVPAAPLGEGRESAVHALEEALAQLRDAGLEADGAVGHPDPFIAVAEAWDPKRYDEIIVSTLPIGVSKWLHAGLPERIERATGALVSHVVAEPPGAVLTTAPPPAHEDHGVLAPLSVLGWGRPKRA
jgi:LmbE family N-acetylglucosaminyl deacetylase